MLKQATYSIGDMSRICNISKKALRYYDKIGLIPTQRQDYNNYRYYTYEALLAVPVIKYYKQMGFTLAEMQIFIEGNSPNVYSSIKKSFVDKIQELKEEEEALHRRHDSVKDWYELLLEAEVVLENNTLEVAVKYIESRQFLFKEQTFNPTDIKGTIINIGWTNYVESLNNEITGPVIVNFSSIKDRIANNEQEIKVLQQTLIPCVDDITELFGGWMMASCYHIGSHNTIHQAYEKICTWCDNNGYSYSENSYERYVTDYWTTSNSSQHVTEVMIKVTRKT